MTVMKEWLEKIETLWIAITFAEAGEWETAKTWMEAGEKRKDPEPLRPKRPRLRA